MNPSPPMQTGFSPATKQSASAPADPWANVKREHGHKDTATAIEMVVDCILTDGIDVWQQVRGQEKKRAEREGVPFSFSFRKNWRKLFSEAGAHAAAGEIISDPMGGAFFVGVNRHMPSVMNGLGWALDLKPVDWLYEKLGRVALRESALKKEGIEPGSPAHREKIDEWKFYQKKRIAEWAVVTVGSVAGNVLVQKAGWHLSDNFKRRLHAHDHSNGAPDPLEPLPTEAPSVKTILHGKLKGVLYTFIFVELLGFIFPGAMQRLNHWIAAKITAGVDWVKGRKRDEVEASAQTQPAITETAEATQPALEMQEAPAPRFTEKYASTPAALFQDRIQAEPAVRGIA